MLLRDIMTRNVEAVSTGSTLLEAAQRMALLDVGFLAVIDNSAPRPVGVVTDRDITIRGVAAGLDVHTAHVADVMSPEPVSLSEEMTIEDAARVMEDQQIRRVLVVTGDGRYVGVVSLGDLAIDAGESEVAHEVLESVSRPGK